MVPEPASILAPMVRALLLLMVMLPLVDPMVAELLVVIPPVKVFVIDTVPPLVAMAAALLNVIPLPPLFVIETLPLLALVPMAPPKVTPPVALTVMPFPTVVSGPPTVSPVPDWVIVIGAASCEAEARAPDM